MASLYKQVPLSRSDGARLLILKAGTAQDKPICHLYSIDDELTAHHYVALSYVWGLRENLMPICCNQHTVLVTPNLYDALLHLRNPSQDRVLWVDALCINQEDDIEKSHQVRNMGKIYRYAQHVSIWLGKGSPGSSQAVAFIRYLWELIPNRPDFRTFQDNPDRRLRLLFQQEYHDQWVSLGEFLQREWFSRVWILQEVALCREATMLCGSEQLSLQQLVEVVLWVAYDNSSPYFSPQANRSRTTKLGGFMFAARHNLLEMHLKDGPPKPFRTLYHVLRHSGTSQATDPRDKIYALLGMANDIGPNMELLGPDYSLSLAGVYLSVAEFFLKKQKNLDYWKMMPDTPEYKSSLPSWVVDWEWHSKNPTPRPLTGAHYRAGGSLEPAVTLDVDKRTCFVTGTIVGIITTLGQDVRAELAAVRKLKFDRAKDLVIEENYIKASWFQEMEDMAAAYFPGPEGKEVLWRTMVADTDHRDPDDGKADAETMRPSYGATSKIMHAYRQRLPRPDDVPAGAEARFYNTLAVKAGDRRFALIACSDGGGTVGLVGRRSEVGDVVCLFQGFDVPVTVRPAGNSSGSVYTFVNESYVHGYMAHDQLENSVRITII
ncbi:Heterokaryon incompatibility protein (HET) domain containing protein [Naviculisporaceae sp. PSN 640]